jgi:hypothetical protein
MFSYKILQLGTETVNGVSDVVKEIRFKHCLGEREQLYVVHLEYNTGEKLLTLSEAQENPSLCNGYIETILGPDQIKHMENILSQEIRTYTNIN